MDEPTYDDLPYFVVNQRGEQVSMIASESLRAGLDEVTEALIKSEPLRDSHPWKQFMRKTPTVRRPRDIAALRDHLLAGWSPDRGPYLFAIMSQGAQADSAVWEIHTLQQASLWWVSADMCDLLHAAEQSLPDDVVMDMTWLPRERGLVVFETPMPGVDARTGSNDGTVSAITWGPIKIPTGLAVGIGSYNRMDCDLGLSADELKSATETGALFTAERGRVVADPAGKDTMLVTLHGDIWGPLGRADWPLGERADVRHFDTMTDDALRSMMEDRKRLAALMLLLDQGNVATTTVDRPTPKEQRRAKRSGQPVRSNVHVVDVKRAHRASAHSALDEERRKLNVRFIVDGHWRNQAYGEGRKLRRPTWIAPHWRGPDDGPISQRKTVRVIRPQ